MASTAVAELLWAACRPSPEISAVRRAAVEADPQAVVAAALAHQAAGLVRRALRAAGSADVLGQPGEVLHTVAEVQRMEQLLVWPAALRMAVEPLQRAGLAPVVLKGAALADRYPEAGLRSMVDIDLLLPRDSHRAAVAALGSSGWRPQPRHGGGRYDTVLTHPDVCSLAVEVHYGLQGWHERANRLSPDMLWRRRIPGRCLGVDVDVLPVEEELVLLASHAGKPFHCFSRLTWLTDLVVVAEAAGAGARGGPAGVDWEAVAGAARRFRCETVVATATAMAERLGLQLPAGVLSLPESGWQRRALAPLLQADWPMRFVGGPDVVVPFHLRFALADTWWRRMVLAGGGFYGRPVGEQVAWPLVAAGRAVRRWRRLQLQP